MKFITVVYPANLNFKLSFLVVQLPKTKSEKWKFDKKLKNERKRKIQLQIENKRKNEKTGKNVTKQRKRRIPGGRRRTRREEITIPGRVLRQRLFSSAI